MYLKTNVLTTVKVIPHILTFLLNQQCSENNNHFDNHFISSIKGIYNKDDPADNQLQLD
jgi:hypothetical protein